MKSAPQSPLVKTQDEIDEDHRIAALAQSMMGAFGMNFDYKNDPDTMARINGQISAEEHTNKVESELDEAIVKS